ncbi:T6SS immunity protein Tli4 family protein [uncultured Gilliamella sp.]|uniref:T6SS immunity protein Tli4 family protein n=1 Tax=uncultured Gilliamella sp. TaxID=1193505 RepID=UPI0025E7B4DF|nr:T6SS immunity protein Tli4 family protein [uncultured Gilliamella sp.]
MIRRVILLTTLLGSCFASQAVELNYKTECIGSYTVDLPDNLEVALYPTKQYLEPKSRYPIYFADGKWAILSTFNYNRNKLSITANWDHNNLIEAKKQMIESNQSVKVDYPDDLVELWNKKNGFGFYASGGSHVTFVEENRVYSFFSSKHYQGKERNFDFYKQNAEAIINGFSTRELFEVPQTAGKCIPYGFVTGNDPTTPLNLTVSFRLNDHPDIVISFSENTDSFTNSFSFKAKDEINLFWNDNYDINNNNIKDIKLLGFLTKYRDIEMDGRNGTAGFVEIRYKDKSPSDYGYYGVVSYYSRNDKSQVNHPWLLLTVIGKRDEAKGHTPLSKDEIYQLAKTIEASIKRRPTE